MSLTKNVIALIITILFSFQGKPENSFSNRVNIDSLCQLVKIYSTENPEIAGFACHRLAEQSQKGYNDSIRIIYQLGMSQYKAGQGLNEIALAHVDTAIHISQYKTYQKLHFEALQLKTFLLLSNGNYSEALRINEKSRIIALKSKIPSLIVKATLIRGDIYKEFGQYLEAISRKIDALQLSKTSPELEAECYQSIGSTYWFFGNYQDALKSYYQGLIAAEKCSDSLRIIQLTKNIGLTYRELGNFDKAISMLNSALLHAQKQQIKSEISDILNIFGGVYLKFGRPADAISYYKQSLSVKKSINYSRSSINTLNNLARAYLQQKNNEEAIQSLSTALEIANKIADPLTQARIQNEMGNIYLNVNNFSESLRRYLLALKLRQSYGKEDDIARTMVNIALVYRKIGLHKNAQKYVEDAKKLVENIEVKSDLRIYIYQNLGHIMYDQKKFEEAIKTYRIALDLSEKKGDETQIVKLLKNIAQCSLEWGKISQARNAITQSIKIALRNNQNNELAESYNTLGNIERAAKNYQLAISHFNLAAEKYQKASNLEGKALCLRKIGEIQIIQKNYKEAQKKINQSINIGIQSKNYYLVSFGYQTLSELFKKQGNYAKALALYQKHIGIRDSLESIKLSEKNMEAHLNLELDKTKSEIKLIESEVETLRTRVELDKERLDRQRTQRKLLITLVAFLLFIAISALFLFNQKKNLARLQREKYEEVSRINDMLVKSQAELQQTIKTKDKLFSIIAHDLRSPFTALLGLSEVLASNAENLKVDEVKDFALHINKSANEVLSLTENLLSWARSQTGKLTLSPKTTNLKELLNKTASIARIPAQEKSIDIEISCSDDLTLFVDEDTLTTTIRNLLSNAIKFTPTGGKITVRVFRNTSEIAIQVSDTGVGIAPENINKLFKLDGFTTKGTNSENGTGLGLMLCKEFTEANGGTISVQSIMNHGTTFTITFPLK